MDKINALLVIENGPYYNLDNIEPWSEKENAFNCKNGAPAICHPPCKRWGRYAKGGPSARKQFLLGDDDCAFAYSLWYVRTFGGIIEHPEGTHAYKYYGLNCPTQRKGWVKADEYGGITCSIAQGNYGHKARKMTWLYSNKIRPFAFDLTIPEAKNFIDMSPKSKQHAIEIRNDPNYKPFKRISQYEMSATPIEFRNLLIDMVKNQGR